MNERLGWTYKDQITGFKGVAIGHCEYLTGCNQTLLQPQTDDLQQGVSKRPESEWFDDQRMIKLEDIERVVLDNSKTPGFDKAAPKR